MSNLQEDWNKLDNEHKKFVIRVRNSGGCKHGADPCSIDSDVPLDPPHEQYFHSIELYEKAEKSGFIICTGSYKWIVTPKFGELERELLGISYD